MIIIWLKKEIFIFQWDILIDCTMIVYTCLLSLLSIYGILPLVSIV